ncbi:MAG: large conductance mechanosensitive channel protein MscL [Nocardioidaceae bacterium]
MFKGFKDFLLRGNIVDLAVAVVIGTAFVALVASFTENFINPLIARAGGGGANGGKISIGGGQYLGYGNFITACITFLITAAVVYFAVVVPMKRIMERFKKPEEEAVEEVAEEVALLTEIRDLLGRAEQTPSSGGNHSM